ncbi:MAG: DKNYY domain-containing protein [Tannerellaceae bacterium]|nr:DKNYY domain-containing protein [Tannerellaceae bacterium]
MKKLIITFTICLVCAGAGELKAVNYSVASVQQSTPRSIGDGYTKDSRKVYFRGNEVKYAVPGSFHNLGSGYAKDDFAVFYNGVKIPGASVSTFRPTQDGYATDNIRTYYRGKDASKMALPTEDDYPQIAPEGYCIYEGKVYYNAVEMEDADIDSFFRQRIRICPGCGKCIL